MNIVLLPILILITIVVLCLFARYCLCAYVGKPVKCFLNWGVCFLPGLFVGAGVGFSCDFYHLIRSDVLVLCVSVFSGLLVFGTLGIYRTMFSGYTGSTSPKTNASEDELVE